MKDQRNLQDLYPRTTPQPDRDFPQLSGKLLSSVLKYNQSAGITPSEVSFISPTSCLDARFKVPGSPAG